MILEVHDYTGFWRHISKHIDTHKSKKKVWWGSSFNTRMSYVSGILEVLDDECLVHDEEVLMLKP